MSIPLPVLPDWPRPSAFPALRPGEAHVWLFALTPDPARLARFRGHLSPEELQRADRFRFPKDQFAFAAARGQLREVLGLYLDLDPRALRFDYNGYGKPSLSAEHNRPAGLPGFDFNLSHSHGLGLLAVTGEGALGVDIEQVRPSVMGEEIAERFFSEAEVASLSRVPPDRQAEAFFACWTRKEAYIKARGDGLSRSLDTFTVTLAPEDPPAVVWSKDDPEASVRWTVHRLPAPAGYAASLIVPRTVERVVLLSRE